MRRAPVLLSLLLTALPPGLLAAAEPPPATSALSATSDRSIEVLRYGCASELGRREVTLFANGTVRLREGAPGEDWMGLAELNPDELTGAIHRLEEEDLGEIGQLPSGVEGTWVERCTFSLQLAGRKLQLFRFGRYDTLPLALSRVIRVAEDVAAKVLDVRGNEELPPDYEPRPMDILKRRDGEHFRVLGFTADKLGVELEGVNIPLSVYVPRADMKREFVALIERKGKIRR
jgi:hypothetical protein